MPESTLRLPTRSPDATGGQRRSRRGRNSLIAALTAVGLVGLGVVGAWAWWNGSVGSVPIREHCTAHVAATASNPIRIAEFDPEQAGNAAIIAAVAGERGMPARAVSIGIATAIQESKLRNIDMMIGLGGTRSFIPDRSAGVAIGRLLVVVTRKPLSQIFSKANNTSLLAISPRICAPSSPSIAAHT